MFFACAPQTVDIDGVPMSFHVDPADTSVCRIVYGDWTLTFQRNGPLLRSERAAQKEPDDGLSEGHEESGAVGDKLAAGDEHPSEGDAEQVSVGGRAASKGRIGQRRAHP